MLLAAALNAAGVNRGDRARTTEDAAVDGNNPPMFKELLLIFNGSVLIMAPVVLASKSTGGVGGLPPVVVAASEAIGVVDASEPSFVKNGRNEPEPLPLKSVEKISLSLFIMYNDENS